MCCHVSLHPHLRTGNPMNFTVLSGLAIVDDFTILKVKEKILGVEGNTCGREKLENNLIVGCVCQ